MDEQQLRKEAASKEWQRRYDTANGCGADSPRRLNGIRARVDAALLHAEESRRRAEVAYRAKQIIDKNPEFAELLDLLNEL